MSEHEKETEFLQHCLRYDASPGREVLAERIGQIQRDERSVRRAIWLMALLAVLAGVGLGYSAVLIETFPQDTSQLIVKFIAALGLAALICSAAFAVLALVYRARLNEHREECRQTVVKLLEHRLGQLPVMAEPDHARGEAAEENSRASHASGASAQG